jgi:dipeptidyl aminopeptidase/acylaminoacyl peptidase
MKTILSYARSALMKAFLSLVLLISPLAPLWGQGPTKEFEVKNEQARTFFAKVLPDGRAQVLWGRSNEEWGVCLKQGEQQLVGGRIAQGEFQPEEQPDLTWEDSLPSQVLRSNANFPKRRFAKKVFGEVEQQAGALRFAGQEFAAGEGWVWEGKPFQSPSRDWFCLERVKNVPIRQVKYVRSSPEKQLQPEFFTRNYPKPGDDLRDRVPVVFSKDGQKIEVDETLIADPYSVSKLHWRGKDVLWFEFIERGFGKFRLLELNARTGKTRVVAEETSEKFVHVFEKCGWWDLGDGQLLWRSEADGWSHLYQIDEQSGERKQLTQGEWVVRGVERVEGDEVIFRLSGFYLEQDPYYVHFAKLNWKTGEMTMLTHGNGTHELFWSPDRSYYVARYSRVDFPPVYELRKGSDGTLVSELWRTEEKQLKKMAPYLPERFITTDREGRYEIHGVIWKPRNFDPYQTYPVVENIYAGPHGAFVPKSWRTWYGHKSELAEAGFVVVQIDGRGTNFRGREFQQFAYKNIKDSGFPDRIKWMKEAARNRPWMDLSRVGVYGGSAGGQSTLAALLWHGDFYRAGAADCGCHDNRMDKIWWNEQWMDWPIDDSYRANSNTEHVAQLQGELFLTVGEVDTNVDPSSTYQVVDALIRADKNFEFYLAPNGGHGVGSSPYFRRKRLEFFQRSLAE